MKKFYYLASLLSVLALGGCSNDDESVEIVFPDPVDQWSATMRGDNQSIRAYPDIFANYWEYTYSYAKNPNVGLRLKCHFPEGRFFNFTVYNDDTQINVSSIEDVNIKPDAGSVNPYVKTTSDYDSNTFTVNIIPENTPASMRTGLSNICEFPESIEKLSVIMRLYLGMQYSGDEYGGVKLPQIESFDVRTGEAVSFPEHLRSNLYDIPDLPTADFSDAERALTFMRAPFSMMYPNAPAEYLFTRIKLNTDTVAMFRFIPPVAPKSVGEYASADVRYWSICLGASSTLSYASIYDEEMPKCDADGYVTIMIADKNSANLDALRKKAAANNGTYVMAWDRQTWGSGILALYRNMVINDNYGHSMRKLMEPIPMEAAAGDMSKFNPLTMIAMIAMGNWGPQGYKFSEADYLSDSFNYAGIRRLR